MQIKDIIAVMLGIICVCVLGAGYFLSGTSASFQSIFGWCVILILSVTLIYLYFAYLRQR